MSTNSPTSFHEKNREITRSVRKRPHADELDSINKRLHCLKDEVLPVYPFLLTVPSDVPFRLGNRYINNWAVGKDGPFAPEEQQLQYMTFLTHYEGDSLLVAVGDWSDESGNIMAEDDSKPASVTSAASTPLSVSVKKKISLSDYKSKAKNGVTVSSKSQETLNGNAPAAETLKHKEHISKPGTADDETFSQLANSRPPKSHSQPANGRKRSAEPEEKPPKAQERRQPGSPSPKRTRLSPLKTVSKVSSSSNSAPNSLPALLSPTLPPASISPKLPRLLSPTLPPDIEEELARLRGQTPVSNITHKRNVSTTSSTTKDDPSRAKFLDGNTPHSGSFSSSSNQSTNDKAGISANTVSSTGSKFKRLDSRELSKNDGPLRPSERLSQSVSSSTNPKTHMTSNGAKNGIGITAVKTRLIIKLRYGRSNRKRVEALLKFSGKRKLAAESAPPKPAKDHELSTSKGEEDLSISRRVNSDRRGEKRPRPVESEESQELSKKRSKAPDPGLSEPRTPVPAEPKPSSAQQQQSSILSTFSTPKKDVKGLVLRRAESGEAEVRTPSGLANKTTPGSVEKNMKLSPPPSSDGQASWSRDRERRAWRDEYQKYAGLGRELKHAANRHTADAKLAAATAVEAILCFILAFIADDRFKTLTRQVPDSTNWRSILAYWRVVTKNSAAYPHLHGLCLLLGAISHDTIHALDLERLSVSSLPGEHSPVPTPGSDGNAVTSDESKKYRMEFLDLKSRLPEYYKEALHLWLEGGRKLSDEVLRHEFPSTWSKRSRDFSERGKQRLKIGEYSGQFFLPLGRTTTPLEAVRFGWSVLSEWCKREGVEWQSRLQL